METVIELGLDRLDQVFQLEKSCFPDDHYSRETLEEMLGDKRTCALGYEEDNKIVAIILLYSWKGEKDFVKIISMGVDADYRRLGYGHKLLTCAEDLMIRDDLNRVKAETRQSNLSMQSLFEVKGYVLTDKVSDYYNDPLEDALVYEKFK